MGGTSSVIPYDNANRTNTRKNCNGQVANVLCIVLLASAMFFCTPSRIVVNVASCGGLSILLRSSSACALQNYPATTVCHALTLRKFHCLSVGEGQAQLQEVARLCRECIRCLVVFVVATTV